jgi:K+-sensing histidine kinase KdpD
VKVARGTVAEAHLRMGVVAEEIVGLADELDAGLIVVGSRGRGRIRRTLAGRVSESVFRYAHCPAMVVRAKVNPPSRRGGGRPRVRRVFSQEVRQASSALAQAGAA